MIATKRKTIEMVRKVVIGLLIALMIGSTAIGARAQVYTDQIELTTRSVILVDTSGSMKDQDAVNSILVSLDISAYDAVMYFDSQGMTPEPGNGGGNSSICEAIDAAAKGGFTHITVVTDGEQWPAQYSALGVYADKNIRIILTEELDAESEKLLTELKAHFVKSTIKVELPDGEFRFLLGDYQPPKYTVEIDIPDPDGTPDGSDPSGTGDPNGDPNGTPDGTPDDDPNGDPNGTPDGTPDDDPDGDPDGSTPDDGTTANDGDAGQDGTDGTNGTDGSECNHKCWWWLALLLAVLLAALFDLIHELITRDGGWQKDVTQRLKKGSKLLLDLSGSMQQYAAEVLDVARRAKSAEVIAFADMVKRISIADINLQDFGGLTRGVEALKLAASAGWAEVVLVSDLEFNGETLKTEDFEATRFKRITILAPSAYNASMVSELKKIADEVEVLYL